MGYNTSILICNADLDRIAADEKFGERLAALAKSAPSVISGRRREATNDIDRADLQVSIRDIARHERRPDIDPGYTISGVLPLHADEPVVHVVEDGRLRSIRAFSEEPVPAELLRALAYAMAHRGHEVRTASKTYRDASPVWLGEDQWMSNWTRDTLQAGFTFLLLANDALDQIEGDEGLGARLARGIDVYRRQRQSVMNAKEAKTPMPGAIGLSDHLASGNHANAILRLIPVAAARRELIVSGGNEATALRPGRDDTMGNYEHVRRILARNGYAVRSPGAEDAPPSP